MTIASERLPVLAQATRRRASLSVLLDRQDVFSWLMMALPLAFLAALVGYPFVYGILLSLEDRPVAHAGTFVGFKNFVTIAHDPIFWRVAFNTFMNSAQQALSHFEGQAKAMQASAKGVSEKAMSFAERNVATMV